MRWIRKTGQVAKLVAKLLIAQLGEEYLMANKRKQYNPQFKARVTYALRAGCAKDVKSCLQQFVSMLANSSG
jgi:hypothetical protein